MRKFSHTNLLISFLIISLVHQPLLAQKKVPSRQVGKRSTAQKTQIADAVIAEISEMTPLPPVSAEAIEAGAKPPGDNAPIEKIFAYWRNKSVSDTEKSAPPSDTIRQRLLEECINRPDYFSDYLELLPKTPATYDRLYQLINENVDGESDLSMVHLFLKNNSQYFREELIADARTGEIGTLAKLDWEAAQPFVEKLVNSGDPQSIAKGLTLSREHALLVAEKSQAEMLLTKLKAMVVNQQINLEARVEALHHVMSGDWDGREKWFLGLFADASLSGMALKSEEIIPKTYPRSKAGSAAAAAASAVGSAAVAAAGAVELTAREEWAVGNNDNRHFAGQNFLAQVTASETEQWVPKVLRLVGNNDPVIHNSAVRYVSEAGLSLVTGMSSSRTATPLQKEVARTLLPWLQNSNWTTAPLREQYILSLGQVKLPEALPGLISLISTADSEEIADAAVLAVGAYQDPVTTPLLKGLAEQAKTEKSRLALVASVVLANGYSDAEMAVAYEEFAKKSVSTKGTEEIESGLEGEKPLSVSLNLGFLLGSIELRGDGEIKFSEGFLQIVFARIKELRKSHPAVAQTMLEGIQRSPYRLARINLIERLSEGTLAAVNLAEMLKKRQEFQKNLSDSLYPLLAQGGVAAGISAVMLGEAGRMQDVLTGKDVKAKLALLVAAKYVREKLPVVEVAQLLNNPSLSEVAEQYLEIENSAAARSILWARHPNQVFILGEKDGMKYGNVSPSELEIQKEILRGDGAEQIYAFLAQEDSRERKSIIVRVKKDMAQISILPGKGFRKIRDLTASEWQDLKALTAQPEIENLAPEIYPSDDEEGYEGEGGGANYTYVRLSKESGRRIEVANLQRAPKKDATHYEQLSGIFYSMVRTGNFKVRYDIQDKIKGVEVVFANEKRPIFGIGKEKNELRVYSRNDESTATTNEAKNVPQWYAFENSQFGAVTNAPKLVAESYELYNDLDQVWENGRAGIKFLSVIPDKNITYLTKELPAEEAGVYKLSAGGKPEKILSGLLYGLEVTPDEKWLVTTRIDYAQMAKQGSPFTLVRVNLQTKQEFVIPPPPGSKGLYPHSPLPDSDLILLTPPPMGENRSTAKSYWLDAQTGKIQPATGELRPLLHKSFIPFQPAAAKHTYWVTFYDNQKSVGYFGLYNVDNLTFQPSLELPGLQISSDSILADEASGYVYLAHEGNLLRAPLSKK